MSHFEYAAKKFVNAKTRIVQATGRRRIMKEAPRQVGRGRAGAGPPVDARRPKGKIWRESCGKVCGKSPF